MGYFLFFILILKYHLVKDDFGQISVRGASFM